ncbi:Cap1p Ecym_2441 [Eremothecium cymbalariae DBVPG|uniref:F-actin-capping protein subunit alpha n=1 Tax=Eremothecium cymbalariae (strain CBS 270.75 / DBVPG 7215 / KCTC 17166 / NRRL Y-17582) TaxID=931890 RepID=G8JPB3_ERECY|nr:Hypothetical protein Ecym_2441 [Eremothecium cymbalariae DBVPG\
MSKFVDLITQLVFDAAPQEINTVSELLATVTDNKSNDVILQVVGEYNVAKRLPIDLNGSYVFATEYNKQGSKFYDPFHKVLFSVDHLKRVGLDVESHEVDVTKEQKDIYEQLGDYISGSFPGSGTYTVLPADNADELVIIIVSTRYSPNNYWSGYWKSEYIYNSSSRSLKGDVHVSTHYYEDGNVQFNTSEVFDEEEVDEVVKTIHKLESAFEARLDKSFRELNEGEFAKLRRRLPVTRSKVSWGKAIGNYRLGKDASKGM